MNKIETNNYKRVSKQTALNIFNNGNPVYLLPCNMNPDNVFNEPFNMQRSNRIIDDLRDSDIFNKIINEYSYYNCNNETGKYTAFYIKNGLPINPTKSDK